MRPAALDGKVAMRSPHQSAHTRSAHLKDEVYRQMFRLEENRPGANMGLALALIHAWIATETEGEIAGYRDWILKLSPICVQMIEASLSKNPAAFRCAE